MPFSVINDINAGKETENLDKYNAYIINRFYSFFPDTLYFAQCMNLNYDLDNTYQHRFLINTIRPSKRWQKWLKKEKVEDYDAVRDYYGFSDTKVKEALAVLSNEQINVIKRILKGE